MTDLGDGRFFFEAGRTDLPAFLAERLREGWTPVGDPHLERIDGVSGMVYVCRPVLASM